MNPGSSEPSTGQRMSAEAYFALDDQALEEKYEFENGIIHFMDGVSVAHSHITYNVRWALQRQLPKDTCSVSGPTLRTQVLPHSCYYYPDVVVSCTKMDHKPTNTLICYPHLVVEVLSAESAARDCERKLPAYQQCTTMQEIVLVEEYRKLVEIHTRQKNTGLWARRCYWPGEIVYLESLGLTIDMEEVYQGIDFTETEPESPGHS